MDEATTRSGLTTRAACRDDVVDITVMLNAASRELVGRPTAIEEVNDRLATPKTTVELDTVVAFNAEGALVGFGNVWPAQPDEIRCFGRTHPEHRGVGAGTAVQKFLIGRARELAEATECPNLTRLTTTTWPHDKSGECLLTSLGYRPARFFQKMVIDFGDQQPVRLPDPAGLLLRGFEEGDEPAIFAAFVEAFAEHWGEEYVDETDWWLDHRDGEAARYDPSLWLVAVDDGEMAGFVTARVQQDSDGRGYGYICDLGVRPGWRGRGLGECLLSRSLGMLHDRGFPYAALDVDTENTTGAVRLYTKVGMQTRPSMTIWSIGLGTEVTNAV